MGIMVGIVVGAIVVGTIVVGTIVVGTIVVGLTVGLTVGTIERVTETKSMRNVQSPLQLYAVCVNFNASFLSPEKVAGMLTVCCAQLLVVLSTPSDTDPYVTVQPVAENWSILPLR